MLACGRGRALRIELYFVASLLMFAFVVCRDQMTDTDAKIIKYIEALRCRCDHIHAEAHGNTVTIQSETRELAREIAMKKLSQTQEWENANVGTVRQSVRSEGRESGSETGP